MLVDRARSAAKNLRRVEGHTQNSTVTISLLRAGFQELLYPRLCSVCEGRIETGTRFVCLGCRMRLATLDLHRLPENELTDRFWGRLPVTRGAALLPYGKGLPAQHLIWKLKYDNRPDIGHRLGGWLGSMIAEASETFGGLDAIVPVPLHPRRLAQRGYNQAERIAAGLGESLGVPVVNDAVLRVRETSTQTRKSGFERVENMQEVFGLSPKPEIHGRRVLLVDDVMTTGATLEAVGAELVKGGIAELKVATLALARRF